jgi:MoaA/NifB/PqqE/SkfB family radical SAM enzyme
MGAIVLRHERSQFGYLADLAATLGGGKGDPLPRGVEIHPTDVCNHRCDYCFHGGTGFDPRRAHQTLSLENYIDLFGQMAELGIRSLSIAGGGEPLGDRRTRDIVEHAHKLALDVRIVTHGNLLSAELDDTILRCREIRVSVDAIFPETYEKIRHVPGKKLYTTLQNITRIIRKRNAGTSNLNIGVSFLISEYNYSEVEEFCLNFLRLGIDAIVIKHDIYDIYTTSGAKWDEIRERLSKIDDVRLEIRPRLRSEILGHPCIIPYVQVVANPYGDIFSCPLGSQPGEKNGYCLGNIKRQTLLNLWQGSRAIRQNLRVRGVSCTRCNSTDAEINQKFRSLVQKVVPAE